MSGPRVSREQAERVARLARISLTFDESASLRGELASILRYVNGLGPLEPAPERARPPTGAAPLRDDGVRDSLDRDAVLSRAPLVRGGHFIVPRVIR